MTVLQYVPVRDVVRTERTSRRWREVVLRYLRGVKIIILQQYEEWNKTHYNVCYVEPSKYESFEMWTYKLGSSAVAGVVYDDWKRLETIRVNCPNLETLTLVNFGSYETESSPCSLNEDFKCLQRLCFSSCVYMFDKCVSQFLADKSLEQLDFINCYNIFGEFLDTMNASNLKSLVFDECPHMYQMLPYERLSQLTELKLTYGNEELNKEIQFVLDKMPKLETLELHGATKMRCWTIDPLCRLAHLKHLKLGIRLTIAAVIAVLRSCRELETLSLLDCCLFQLGSAAQIAGHGAGLTSLLLDNYPRGTDDDVLGIIHGCPSLTWLMLCGPRFLSASLPARAAAAWRAARPGLRLGLEIWRNTNLETEDRYVRNSISGSGEIKRKRKEYQQMLKEYPNLEIVFKPQEA